MENLLRKRLAIIKARAQLLKNRYLEREAARDGPRAASRLNQLLGRRASEAPTWKRYLDPGEPPRTLESAAPGREVGREDERSYLIRLEGADIDADAPGAAEGFVRVTDEPLWHRTFTPGWVPPGDTVTAERVCFFDIETTGLSPATYVFLCGMMYVEGGRFVVDQAFARDYAEERGMLLQVKETVSRFPLLVTYNGASFDIPFVKTRMAVGRIRFDRPFENIDLLPHARRAFRGILPNRRLETVERHLRGVERVGDIPGKEIPDAYHDFVRRGDARAIEHILYHNRMDLLAMAILLEHLARGRPPEIRWPY